MEKDVNELDYNDVLPADEPKRITLSETMWALGKYRGKQQQLDTLLADADQLIAEHTKAIDELKQYKEKETERAQRDMGYFTSLLSAYYAQQNEGNKKPKPVTLPGGHKLTVSRGGYDYQHDDTVIRSKLIECSPVLDMNTFFETIPQDLALKWGDVKKHLIVRGYDVFLQTFLERDTEDSFVNIETGESYSWSTKLNEHGEYVIVDESMTHDDLVFDPESNRILVRLNGVSVTEKERTFVIDMAKDPE